MKKAIDVDRVLTPGEFRLILKRHGTSMQKLSSFMYKNRTYVFKNYNKDEYVPVKIVDELISYIGEETYQVCYRYAKEKAGRINEQRNRPIKVYQEPEPPARKKRRKKKSLSDSEAQQPATEKISKPDATQEQKTEKTGNEPPKISLFEQMGAGMI